MGLYSEKSSYIYEISNDYKLNAKAVYNATFYCKLILEIFTEMFLCIVLKLNNYIKFKTALLPRAHLYFNGIFYSNFCLELLNITEANFSQLLYCLRLLLLSLSNVLVKNLYLLPKFALYF